MTFLQRSLTLVLLVAAVIIGAALLAPPVHDLAVAFGLLQANDFLRVFRRIGMIGLLIVLAWSFRPWSDGSVASYGMTLDREALAQSARMFAVAAVAVLTILAFQSGAGFLAWRQEIDWSSGLFRAARYLLAGFVIAGVEELVFRGWMYRRLSRSQPGMTAAMISSAAYAFAHSFRARNLSDEVSHDWQGVLKALGGWLAGLGDFDRVGAPMIGLFLFGMLLAVVTRIHGSIMPAIGIHAGAVFVLYSYGSFTTRVAGPVWAGTKAIYDGAPAWIFLLLVLLLLHPKTASEERPLRETSPEPGV